MTDLLANLRALRVIHTQQEQLAARKQTLERQARQASVQTRSRACRLMSDAVLALLSRDEPVNWQTLTQEIEARAHERDRFAIALARDWLEEATRSDTPGEEDGEVAGQIPRTH